MLAYSIAMTVLIPLVMLFAGWMMQKHPPKKISSWYGYRTKRSMQSQAAWDFAHQVCGGLWIKWGTVLLIGSGLVCIAYPYVGNAYRCVIVVVAVLVQILLLVGTILPTERALQKQFDENGNPKDKRGEINGQN